MVKPNKEVAEDIIRRIMSEGVPEKGQLVHPLKNGAKKKTTRQIKITDADTFGFPSDIESWTNKTFVDYFAKKYQEVTGANYRKSYRADNIIFEQMGSFMLSNGLEKNQWVKKFVDWAIKRKDEIFLKEGHFTPQEILRYVNHFYQDQVLPKVEQNELVRDTQDTKLLEEIDQAVSEGKLTEVFCRFGIPVGTTYLVNIKKVDVSKVAPVVEDKIKSLASGSILEQELLGKMLQSSIIGSPYPSGYEGLDWRETFNQYVKPFKKEAWWRDTDYKGRPLPKYYSLLGDKK